MQKIISLFQRNYDGDRLVRDEVVPGAEWVAAGAGAASRKWDGSCCLIRDGRLFKRYDAKRGKTPPLGFEPAQEPDPNTGHWPGWLPIGDGPNDCWHREAWDDARQTAGKAGLLTLPDGTYELVGPRVQGNAEAFSSHVLIPHGYEQLPDAPRDFLGLRNYLATKDIEGIVWRHPDGRMVKIKTKDFGLKRAS